MLRLYLKSKFLLKYKRNEIRFSISYLYRIYLNGNYLLVYNTKNTKQLQPVGGAYKKYGDDKLFHSWGVRYSKRKEENTNKFNDLRFYVEGRHCYDVINWFKKKKEREINVFREFKEELLDNNILNFKIFSSFACKFIKREYELLKWNNYYNCYEIKIFDIVELIPNEIQLDDLKRIFKRNQSNYAFVSRKEILSKKFVKNGKEYTIGKHTRYIL